MQLQVFQLVFHQHRLKYIFDRYLFDNLHTTPVSISENHSRMPFSLGNKIHLQELSVNCSSKNTLSWKGYIGTSPKQQCDDWVQDQVLWIDETEAEHCHRKVDFRWNVQHKKMLFLFIMSFQTPLLAPTSQSDASEIVMNLDHPTGQEMSGYLPESSLSSPPPLQRVMDPGMFSCVLFPACLAPYLSPLKFFRWHLSKVLKKFET